MSTQEQNKRALRRWYNDMWGKCNHLLVPDIAGPKYLRHDLTGANNLMTSEQYRDIVEIGLQNEAVTDFTYFLIAEGDYVASLGRYLLTKGRQWDWVQLFRLENAAMVETWLPAMGGTDILAYPQPHNVWKGTEIPPALPATANKELISGWYRHIVERGECADAGRYFADAVRVHDNIDADVTLAPAGYQQDHVEAQLQCERISDLQLFMIEEGDIVVAAGSWRLDGERQWDWVQAFQIENGKIARTWLPGIGGNDTSLTHGPDMAWAPDAMPTDSYRVVTD
jgi:predicted SnoaL-like aldol condensation-catalyzing enzyme